MQFKNLSILITGASHGLEKALAMLLGEKGANLYLASRTIENTDFPFSAKKIKCDIRDPKQVKNLFSKIEKLDAVINCVGIPLLKPLTSSADEEIINTIQTNLTGLIFVCKYAITKLKNSKNAHIINIISTSGKKARENETVYCASKWGLSGFTKSLQFELQPLGIKVSAVYPGGMKSWNFWKGARSKEEIKHYLEPKEVASQILNLLFAENSSNISEVVIERFRNS